MKWPKLNPSIEMNLRKKMKTTWALFAMLVSAFVLVGCGPLETNSSPSQAPITGDRAGAAQGSASVFAVGDLVKIDFSGPTSPPQAHEEHIKDDGTISLYLVGSIKAAGRSPGQLQKDIQDAYVPRFYKNLNVTVKGADRFYFVGGEVKQPNRQYYYGPITVTGAIKSAGDFTDFANKRKVKLIRADGSMHTIDTTKAQENPSLDLPVYPGDKIDVPARLF